MMKSVLLIGLGRFGRHVAEKLDELHHQVMAVDMDEKRVEKILPYVTNAQIGDSTDEEFMESLGIRNFDVCIVAIGENFQSSLETTSLLKELGAKLVVARAGRDVHAKFLLKNGADEVVYPEKQLLPGLQSGIRQIIFWIMWSWMRNMRFLKSLFPRAGSERPWDNWISVTVTISILWHLNMTV